MPIYIYRHPKTGKTKQIMQTMSELHEYFEGKTKWERVWTVPQGVVDGKLDAFSREGFDRKIDATKNSIGDVWKRAEELSHIRAEKRDGVDPVKDTLYKNYKKKTGKEHPHETKEKIEKLNVVI